jgi:hypothetical protein
MEKILRTTAPTLSLSHIVYHALKRYRIKICKIAYDKCFILVYDKANIARSKSCKRGGMRDVNCNRSLNIHWGIAPLVAQLLKAVM